MHRHLSCLGIVISRTRAAAAPRLCQAEAESEWQTDASGEVKYLHVIPRRTLVTPLRVQGTPPGRRLTACRLTEGVFCDNGEQFVRRDNWTSRASAHADLRRRWTGSTTFRLKTPDVS